MRNGSDRDLNLRPRRWHAPIFPMCHSDRDKQSNLHCCIFWYALYEYYSTVNLIPVPWIPIYCIKLPSGDNFHIQVFYNINIHNFGFCKTFVKMPSPASEFMLLFQFVIFIFVKFLQKFEKVEIWYLKMIFFWGFSIIILWVKCNENWMDTNEVI
jgi:hypothetical protein